MNRNLKMVVACLLGFVIFYVSLSTSVEAQERWTSRLDDEVIMAATAQPISDSAARIVEIKESLLTAAATATQEVEVIEPLDRTEPIYEVYKDGWRVDVPVEWQWYIRDLCDQYDLPEKVIYGLILKESTFQPGLESFDGGCWGLAQINTYWITRANITHFTDDYRSRDLCDPYDNLLTLAEMMCYARDTYGLDYSTKMGQNHYLYWHATGKSPVKVTWIGPGATKAFGFAEELVTLQS